MKRLVLTLFLMASIGLCSAQNYANVFINEILEGQNYHFCTEIYDGAIIHGVDGCDLNQWFINGGELIICDSIVVLSHNQQQTYIIDHTGCNLTTFFGIVFRFSYVQDPFDEHTTWKRPNDTIMIGSDLGHTGQITYQWSNGKTTPTIEVMEPGIYSVIISDICDSETYSVGVRDNVEISLATCDLETNHNMVTWPVTAAQAEYIDHLRVKRDGIEVGTANYSDGQFIDAIGSDAASRTYTLIAVATDGTECPIVSYPKETIHMSYTLGMGNTIEMGWNTPTGYDLLGYNICEWNPNDGNLFVIDFVGASVTSYTCSEAMFDYGNIVIQGVENGKTESRLLSNRSWETVGLGEQSSAAFKVYPNPSNGIFTVEGTGTLRIANVLGQEIIAKEIEGNTAIELPQGIYFVRLNGVVRKIVVE